MLNSIVDITMNFTITYCNLFYVANIEVRQNFENFILIFDIFQNNFRQPRFF